MNHPRRFELVRHKDMSGVSGTGTVALGVQWPDGSVSMRWLGKDQAFANWSSLQGVINVHGHNGATEVVWTDV